MCNQQLNELSLNDWARSSVGASEFANAVGCEIADLWDYMTEEGLSGERSSDLILELVRRVLDGRTATKFGEPERVPASPAVLMGRQR